MRPLIRLLVVVLLCTRPQAATHTHTTTFGDTLDVSDTPALPQSDVGNAAFFARCRFKCSTCRTCEEGFYQVRLARRRNPSVARVERSNLSLCTETRAARLRTNRRLSTPVRACAPAQHRPRHR